MSTSSDATRGPVLGLDFGERRLGVALSDAERLIATGLTTIDRRKHPDVFAPLATIIRERRVNALVVGYPLRTDGVEKAGAKTEAVDAFVAALKERFGLPVHLEDEAFTSTLAADSLKSRKPARRGAKGPRDWAREKAEIDRVAACFILQDWLDKNEDGSGRGFGFGKTQSERPSPSPPSPLSDTGGAP